VTAEGLAPEGELNDVQRAFVAEGAAQCGYCTPGLVVALTALFGRAANPDQTAIREALRGHLCRCGSHAAVLRATRLLAQERA
jgi:carbon-monoxide dehydrogenase small subunit